MTLLAADSDPGPYPLEIKVGKTVAICKTGTIQCPASAATCDDTSIASVDSSETDGLLFKGLKPGTTTCSAAATSGFGARRVYKVIVTQ
jgi:hypothetical protein